MGARTNFGVGGPKEWRAPAACRPPGFYKMAQGAQTRTFWWSTHGLESQPQFHEQSPKREKKRKKFVAGEEKKRNLRRRRAVRRRVSNAGCPTQGVQRRGSGVRELSVNTYTRRHHIGQKMAKPLTTFFGQKWIGQNWIGQMTTYSNLFMLLHSSVISSCASLNSSCNASV